MKRAAILATGTEISSGEVVNTNAAWIATRLTELGFEVSHHLVVPDDRELMVKAMDWLAQAVQLIVVSGGLGPTSDDFTREMVAKWAGVPLEFSDSVWLEMNERYRARNAEIRPAHRQQCHFPKTSKILHNHVGTAHGFSLKGKGVDLIAIPGPPRELQGMWPVTIEPELKLIAPPQVSELKVWTCLGVTESAAAEVTELALEGSGYQIGYRATLPYVKVKVWVPLNDPNRDRWMNQVEAALKNWVVARGKDDPITAFVAKLASFARVEIVDRVSRGRLGSRLDGLRETGWVWPKGLVLHTGAPAESGVVGALPADARVSRSTSKGGMAGGATDAGGKTASVHGHSATKSFTEKIPSANEILLKIDSAGDEHSFRVGVKTGDREVEETLHLPLKLLANSRQGGLYLVENAIHWWLNHIPG